MKKFLWSAMALVVICNGFVLARVIYNRQVGEPTTLVLSERELRLPWRYRERDENSGIGLELNWNVFLPPQDCAGDDFSARYNRSLPLTPQLAQQLNFDLTTGFKQDEDRLFYRESSRQVWLALEMDGKAYQGYLQYLEQQIATAQENTPKCAPAQNNVPDCVPAPEQVESRLSSRRERLRDAQVKESRLFVVDMASSRKTLETRYADQPNVVIVPGLIRISGAKDKTYSVYVRSVIPRRIHVPLEFRQQVVDLEPGYFHNSESFKPRYEAKVAVGKLGEPWIQSLTAIK